MKKCLKCLEIKNLDLFYNDKKFKDGKSCRCKTCLYTLKGPRKSSGLTHSELSRRWQKNNPKRFQEIQLKYKQNNNLIEKQKIYRKKNPELIKAQYLRRKNKILKTNKLYKLLNPEKYKESQKKWCKKNHKKLLAYANKRHANKLLRTPKWLTIKQIKEIENIYLNCPKGYEVDHIVPLQGKNVSGLHVPWNLQYLTSFQNRSKGNRFEMSV